MSDNKPDASEKPERPDTTEDVRQVEEAMQALETVAASYRDKDDGYIHLIGLFTFIATLVAAFNVSFKANLEQLGGWIPFCLATAALTGFAAYYSTKLKREEPRTHKERCQKYHHKMDELMRRLNARKLAPATHEKLQRDFVSLKGDASDYLLPATTGKTKLWGHIWLSFILLSYFGWSAWVLCFHAKQ